MSFDLFSNQLTLRLLKPELFGHYNAYCSSLKTQAVEQDSRIFDSFIALCRHAINQTGYYKNIIPESLFDLDTKDVYSLLSRLPVLTKDDVSKNYTSLIARNLASHNIRKSTGGSTGRPFHFELDHQSYLRREAVMWRGYKWAGYHYGMKALYLWGVDSGELDFKKRMKDSLYHRFYNRSMLNSFALNENNISEYIRVINQKKPEIIVSYVNPLYQLAKYILESGCEMHQPKRILTGAEPLYEFQRNKIEQAFGCKVMNTYGCREFMLIAAECEKQNGLHINKDHLIVETINDDGVPVVGEEGDLLITDLFNYGMPLIRYQNGDRAIISQESCTCGNPLPLLKEIKGRKLDAIKAANGSKLPGEFFPHLFKDIRAVKKFQVVQNTMHEVEILVIPDQSFSNEEKSHVQRELDKYTDGSLRIAWKEVDEIALTESGKHRVTICNV